MTQQHDDPTEIRIAYERQISDKEWTDHHREHKLAWENHDKWHGVGKESHDEVHHSQAVSIALAETNNQRHLTAMNGLQAQMEKLQGTFATQTDVEKGNAIRDKQIDELRLFMTSSSTKANTTTYLIATIPALIALAISIVTFVLNTK